MSISACSPKTNLLSYPNVHLILLSKVGMQVSTVIGAAVKEQREEAAWTEGIAIWVAVMVVSGVGERFHSTCAVM